MNEGVDGCVTVTTMILIGNLRITSIKSNNYSIANRNTKNLYAQTISQLIFNGQNQ